MAWQMAGAHTKQAGGNKMDRKNENETAQNMQRAEEKNRLYMEVESRSQNEEFARLVVALFMSRMDPTLE